MANLVRSAKSASDWSDYELIAYNITVSSRSPGEFFPTPDPSLDHIDLAIFNSPPYNGNPALSGVAAGYLGHVDLATGATQGGPIVDFAAETLKLIGFQDLRTIVSRRYTIPLTICGETDHIAVMDVSLFHNLSFVLVLVTGWTSTDEANTKARVVAEAIATFQFNNRHREKRGLDPLGTMTIPCISMASTRPAFYLVPVTMELSNAVTGGRYPATRTQVLVCHTVGARAETGMDDTEYRELALKRFLAFKTLAKPHWEQILEGVEATSSRRPRTSHVVI
jgi:hypothetical protein